MEARKTGTSKIGLKQEIKMGNAQTWLTTQIYH